MVAFTEQEEGGSFLLISLLIQIYIVFEMIYEDIYKYMKIRKVSNNIYIRKTRRGRPCWKKTLHQLAPPNCNKKEKKGVFTSDKWQVTCYTWNVTHDMWQVVNIVSKFQVPSSNG